VNSEERSFVRGLSTAISLNIGATFYETFTDSQQKERVRKPQRQIQASGVHLSHTAWFKHDSSMVKARFKHGSSMVQARFKHGSSTVQGGLKYGSSMLKASNPWLATYVRKSRLCMHGLTFYQTQYPPGLPAVGELKLFVPFPSPERNSSVRSFPPSPRSPSLITSTTWFS
jgi:hypothetical protein